MNITKHRCIQICCVTVCLFNHAKTTGPIKLNCGIPVIYNDRFNIGIYLSRYSKQCFNDGHVKYM